MHGMENVKYFKLISHHWTNLIKYKNLIHFKILSI